MRGELEILVRRYRRMMRSSALAWRRIGALSLLTEAIRTRDLAAAIQKLDSLYGSNRRSTFACGAGLFCGPILPNSAPQPAHASVGGGVVVLASNSPDVILGPAVSATEPATNKARQHGAPGLLGPAPTPFLA